jgi:hypothetical protein
MQWLQYLANSKTVDVINMSLAYNWFQLRKTGFSPADRKDVEEVVTLQKDTLAGLLPTRVSAVVISSAAGNDGGCWPEFPASLSSPVNAVSAEKKAAGWLVVGSLSQDLSVADNACNRGALLFAPSPSVKARCPGNPTDSRFAETSFAAPFVTATAALVASVGSFTGADIAAVLRDTADAASAPDAFLAVMCAISKRGDDPFLILADLNGDGKVNSLDAEIIKLASTHPPDLLAAEDLNGDGVVSIDSTTPRLVFGKMMTDSDLLAAANDSSKRPLLPSSCQH